MKIVNTTSQLMVLGVLISILLSFSSIGKGNYYITDPSEYAAKLCVGQFIGRYESLRDYHDFIKPGAYIIKWNYHAFPGDSWWQGDLVSNEIQIEILAVGKSELEAVRKTLLQRDITKRYGLWVPTDDPRLKAIDQLKSDASPEAVGILQDFLAAHRINCQELKQHALLALGQIGTKPAIDAIKHFEAWADERFLDPTPFHFGFKDCAIDHFAPHNLSPLATTTDDKNRTWAIFAWTRYGRTDIWITQALEKDLWSQPILLDLPAMPQIYPWAKRRWDDKCEFQIKGDLIRIVVDDHVIESSLSSYLIDSDKDGIPDTIEARLSTNPKESDSDRDGLADGKDSNPLTPRHRYANDVSKIRQAVFYALFATGNSQDAIVFVGRNDFAEQEYYGYGGVILHAPEKRPGFVNVVDIKVKLDSSTIATATIVDYEGNMAASGHEAKLKKINGKWVVVEFKMTWIS